MSDINDLAPLQDKTDIYSHGIIIFLRKKILIFTPECQSLLGDEGIISNSITSSI